VNSALFKSTDGAATFTQLNIPSDNVDSVSVGAVSSTVYAVGDVAGLGETVLKSTDGGATWTALKNGLVTFGVIWADPVNASTVFVNDHTSPRAASTSLPTPVRTSTRACFLWDLPAACLAIVRDQTSPISCSRHPYRRRPLSHPW
jgi:hypothetical protein